MSGSKESTGFVTDISTITSVTDVTFLHEIIVVFDKQVRRLEEELSKATQKINQVEEGAWDFTILRSGLETARKQGWNALETLGTETGDFYWPGSIPRYRYLRPNPK